jgi:subtilase family serine protease
MLFGEPSYQQGVVQLSVFKAQGRTGRAIPDIAAVGDPNTGFMIGETQTFPDGSVKYSEYRIGGTSLSSPLVAGIMALANQAAGQPLGFVNPLLYSLAGSAAFTDVTGAGAPEAMVRTNYRNGVDASDGLSYVLRTMNQTQSLLVTTGYDDVTGVGSPAGGLLAAVSH